MARRKHTWIIDTANPIESTSISIDGHALDCNGEVIITFPNGTLNVTPSISSAPAYYTFTITAFVTTDYPLTRSVHPFVSGAPSYNRINFFEDYDPCEEDSRWDTGIDWTYYADSVPVPAELFITLSSTAPQFPWPFYSDDYKDIRNAHDLDTLLDAEFANIKIVESIELNGKPKGGAAMLGQEPATMILVRLAHPSIYKHEFGHTRGLNHRGVTGLIPFNPDQVDVSAAMHADSTPIVDENGVIIEYRKSGEEFNRHERTRF